MLLQILEDTYHKWWADEIKYTYTIYHIISHLLDKNFISSFNTNTEKMYSRWRELYLWNLLNQQYSLSFTQSDFPKWAPDFCIKKPETWNNIWIECVFATVGIGNNKVPEFWSTTNINDWTIPRILRITNSLKEKYEKFKWYKDKWIIEENDECYIAINSDFDDRLDRSIITWACYWEWLTIFKKWSDSHLYWPFYQERNTVNKKNNSNVITNTLLDKNFSIINGVIYNPNNFMHLISNDLKPGDNKGYWFYFLENPYTTNTLNLVNEIHLTYDLISKEIQEIKSM